MGIKIHESQHKGKKIFSVLQMAIVPMIECSFEVEP